MRGVVPTNGPPSVYNTVLGRGEGVKSYAGAPRQTRPTPVPQQREKEQTRDWHGFSHCGRNTAVRSDVQTTFPASPSPLRDTSSATHSHIHTHLGAQRASTTHFALRHVSTSPTGPVGLQLNTHPRTLTQLAHTTHNTYDITTSKAIPWGCPPKARSNRHRHTPCSWCCCSHVAM